MWFSGRDEFVESLLLGHRLLPNNAEHFLGILAAIDSRRPEKFGDRPKFC